MPLRFDELSAAGRLETCCERGSFQPRWQRDDSPLVIGSGFIAGVRVLGIATDGRVRGGTFGVTEAGAVAQTLSEVCREGRLEAEAVLLCLDTGGVRVEEGPRALAATSAAGVLLAECSLVGPPIVQVISGPRGCFGAPAVMAGLPDLRVMVGDCHWGLTGPQLFSEVCPGVSAGEALRATSAQHRWTTGDARWVREATVTAVREAVCSGFEQVRGLRRSSLQDRLTESARLVQERLEQLPAGTGRWRASARKRRRRLLEYSLRRQWKPFGEVAMAGLAQAAWGRLAERPALGVVLGPADGESHGVGIPEVALVLAELARVRDLPPEERALILNCIFCQGHAVDVGQEGSGLPRVLAECLRAYVAVRLLGHRIVSVLGGGTYGAAFLAFAAPSQRILAIRGTKVAPMAPELLRAFQRLKGKKEDREGSNLAELIPEVRVVESVLRLPRALQEEVQRLEASAPVGVGAA